MTSTPVKTILCPVDFSAAAEEAARYAMVLGRALSAERVVFAHVYQRPMYPVSEVTATFMDAGTEEAIRSALRRQLDSLASRYSSPELPVEVRLVEGFPHPEILRLAEAEGADLIVMATMGRTGLSHLLLGSVAEKVVRTSPIPVCTVRAAKA